MQENVINMADVLTISVGDSRKATKWTPKRLTWGDFCEKLREPIRTPETADEYAAMSRAERGDVKDVGGFVGGKVDGARKAGNVESRQLLALDADYGTMELWDGWELMGSGAGCMYTTHSHTPDKPRLRLLVPLTRAVTPDEYEPIARRVAEWLDIEAFDDTTYQPNRLMYWPSCPKDGEYIFKDMPGAWLDPDAVLASYEDWRDMRTWPRSSRQDRIIRKSADKQGDPLTKPGIVGAFNRAHSISDAIAAYLPGIYTPCGTGRWTYAAGSTFGGAVVYDNDTFLYSHHDTDPTGGRLCSAFDLVRLHLYGEHDKTAEEGTPLGDLPSMADMKRLCGADEAVRLELAEGIKQDPKTVFTDENGLISFTGDTTEQGAAKDFTDQYGGALRFNSAFGWMFWDGQKWALDAEAEAYMLALQYADTVYGEARTALSLADGKAEKDRAKERMKQAVRLRSASGVKALLTLSRAIVNVSDTGAYDANPWDLNTPGGIIDLHTGTLRKHDPAAKCTKITAVNLPDDDTGRARWLGFIDHITGGDHDFADYLQMLAGMAAVGAVYEEGLVISYGEGGNGKSTFFNTVRRVLGDYAAGINADILTTTNGKTDQSYVAALRGVRLAIMGETEEGARFSVAQMKRITSRDIISARALYKDPIEFTPVHTAIMHTNYLPKLNSLDGGTQRRIAVAPFPATLPPERVITNYERVLFEECGGAILRWIVEGAMRFYAADCKLAKPACVLKATEEYLEAEDWTARFIDECCDVGAEYSETGGALYQSYRMWVDRNKEYGRRPRDFAQALARAGYGMERRKGMSMWLGLRLKADE